MWASARRLRLRTELSSAAGHVLQSLGDPAARQPVAAVSATVEGYSRTASAPAYCMNQQNEDQRAGDRPHDGEMVPLDAHDCELRSVRRARGARADEGTDKSQKNRHKKAAGGCRPRGAAASRPDRCQATPGSARKYSLPSSLLSNRKHSLFGAIPLPIEFRKHARSSAQAIRISPRSRRLPRSTAVNGIHRGWQGPLAKAASSTGASCRRPSYQAVLPRQFLGSG
jgi:hypothetical protein